jgi:2,3-bisphosphoglycerate-independent phosphoglycerate mutase
VKRFTERECGVGSLGRMRAVDVMAVTMAHALRFKKFGA